MGLFVEDADCRHFLHLLDITALKHHMTVYAYALAGNRGELMFHAPRGNPSAFVQALQTGFARHLHHLYVHSGPVMQGRYKSKLVEPGSAVVSVAAWIHSLPVRENPQVTRSDRKKALLLNATYTSLGPILGGEPDSPGRLDPQAVLKAVGGRIATRPERFQALCEETALSPAASVTTMLSASPYAVGSPKFLEEIRTLHESVKKGKGGKALRLHGKSKRGIAMNKIVEAVAAEFDLNPKNLQQRRRKDLARPALAHFLYNQGERHQQDIAKHLGLTSAAAVSLQIRRLLEARTHDTALDQRLNRVERTLDKLS